MPSNKMLSNIEYHVTRNISLIPLSAKTTSIVLQLGGGFSIYEIDD